MNIDPRTELSIARSLARSARAKHFRQETITWGEVLTWPSTPASTKESAGSYVFGELARCSCPECGGTSERRMRNATSVISRSVLALDVDTPAEDFLDNLLATLPWAALVHTTFSSTAAAPRYRVLVPLDREVAPDEYHALAASVIESYGAESFDKGSTQPWRYMFRPASPDPRTLDSWVVEGPALPTDELLADWDPDLSTLPAPRPHRNKRDPFSLEGYIGAFNRVYSGRFDELVETYELPYEPAGDGRYTLRGSVAVAGVSEIGPGLYYSHHATDPAAGAACSAFDLVRLHRFGDLDEDVKPGTPVNKRPSQAAMEEEASRDKLVVEELAREAFADFDPLLPDVPDDADDGSGVSDWRILLTRNRRGTAILDLVDPNWDLIGEHDPVVNLLRHNVYSEAPEWTADPPWRQLSTTGGPRLTKLDKHALADYIERTYGLRPLQARVEALIARAELRHYDPVREYLLGLKWDGRKRVETALPGVVPTPYTRLVARKVLVAAVARALDPGVKWDHTLVLQGDEGLGKSYWVERMARGHSATLGRIGDKDTLQTLQASWIVVADEGFSLRKADADAMKEFMTRTHDRFRKAYAEHDFDRPRHCVIWATTNDETFLRREAGNRRFLIVKVEREVDFDALTDDYVDQVWAEAVELYRSGERLYLTREESELAAGVREGFTEEDTLLGIIEAYLDTPVPADWDELGTVERRLYLENLAAGAVEAGPARIERVCSVQVWAEALGREVGDHRQTDLRDIAKALHKLGEWATLPGRHRLKPYGPQLVFARLDPEDVL